MLNRATDQRIIIGLALTFFALLAAVVGMLIFVYMQDLNAVHYPNAIPISANSNYKGLPTHYTLNHSFRSSDDFTSVFTWYSLKFSMGAETRANGRCALLEKTNEWYRMQRYMSVFVCDTPDGQMIFVNRATSLR